mmetsp:Transcript_33229/g.77701  ORF Transcript_33229/g.77701 Transcript_33229/m.77701 type:complete len:442 (-) Transcript_33229:193-1518(-)|eukprot:CAMPEP_0178411270 /NCGR_PEP_ID=MMETSP0689_2-20121128/21407_1 /TAXON_ID=160604 /ORGANISM="Amphidinium massartii, Strain CS-259" /LENGTH=441 /DNA_ID=CAMNT_0020032469 /DNA_START=81 /DNA_END=1406 /DNA_ORIENTATION=+
MLQRSSCFLLATFALFAVSEATMGPPACLSDRGHTFLNHELNNDTEDWYWCVKNCTAPPESCEAANAYVAPEGCAGWCEAEDVRQYFLARGYIDCSCELPQHETGYVLIKFWEGEDQNTQCSGDPTRIQAFRTENYVQLSRDAEQAGAFCHQYGEGIYGGFYAVLGCLRNYFFPDADCVMGPPTHNSSVLSGECSESEVATCSNELPDGVIDPDCADNALVTMAMMGLGDPRLDDFNWPMCVAECSQPPRNCGEAVQVINGGCGSGCNATEMTLLLRAVGYIDCECELAGCQAESLATLLAEGLGDPTQDDFMWPACLADCQSAPQDCATAQSYLGAGGCASDCNATEITLLLRANGELGCDCVIPELTTTTTVSETATTTTTTTTGTTTTTTTSSTNTTEAPPVTDDSDSVGEAVLRVGAPKLALAIAASSLLFVSSALW